MTSAVLDMKCGYERRVSRCVCGGDPGLYCAWGVFRDTQQARMAASRWRAWFALLGLTRRLMGHYVRHKLEIRRLQHELERGNK